MERSPCVRPVPVAAVRPARETAKPFVSMVNAPFAETAPATAELSIAPNKVFVHSP